MFTPAVCFHAFSPFFFYQDLGENIHGSSWQRKQKKDSLLPGVILHYDESKAVISVYFFYSNMEVFCVAILSVFLWIIRLKSKQS